MDILNLTIHFELNVVCDVLVKVFLVVVTCILSLFLLHHCLLCVETFSF